jgi:DME family drug/metabolite transporter
MKRYMQNKFSKTQLVGPALIAVAAILWALDGVLRRSLFALPPIVIVFYEHLIGSIILLPLLWKQLTTEAITRKSLMLASGIALLSGLLGTLWFTTALVKVNFISFSVVFLLQKLQPIFATSAAVVLLKEKVSRTYVMWAGLAMLAAFFVTFKNGYVSLATGEGTIVAALYAIGAAAAWGSSTALSKLLLKEHSTGMATGLRFFLTTIFGFIAVLLFTQPNQIMLVDGSQILRFAVIALSTGMVALYIYYKGLQRTQAKIATIIELIFPMLAVSIDAVVYKSFLAPTQIIAALVLLFAIYKASQLNAQKQ